jgi:hypothetical protein
MSVNLSPLGGAGAQFFSNNGVPLAGGLLYTYIAGTSTPAATYTSSSGLTALANPIVLDSAGRVPTGEIWLSDGISYKFVLKSATDVLIATWDNLSGINSNFIAYTAQQQTITATAGQTVFDLTLDYVPTTNNLAVFVNGSKQIVGTNYIETDSNTVTFLTGLNVGDLVQFSTATPVSSAVVTSNNVAYTPAGVSAVATNVQTKLRESVSVMDFGAVGNGTTDDTAAFQAAINTAKTVYIPTPSVAYLLSSGSITIPSGRAFVGENSASCKINITANQGVSSSASAAFIASSDTTITNVNFVYPNQVLSDSLAAILVYPPTVYFSNKNNITLTNITLTDVYDFIRQDSGSWSGLNLLNIKGNVIHKFLYSSGFMGDVSIADNVHILLRGRTWGSIVDGWCRENAYGFEFATTGGDRIDLFKIANSGFIGGASSFNSSGNGQTWLQILNFYSDIGIQAFIGIFSKVILSGANITLGDAFYAKVGKPAIQTTNSFFNMDNVIFSLASTGSICAFSGLYNALTLSNIKFSTSRGNYTPVIANFFGSVSASGCIVTNPTSTRKLQFTDVNNYDMRNVIIDGIKGFGKLASDFGQPNFTMASWTAGVPNNWTTNLVTPANNIAQLAGGIPGIRIFSAAAASFYLDFVMSNAPKDFFGYYYVTMQAMIVDPTNISQIGSFAIGIGNATDGYNYSNYALGDLGSPNEPTSLPKNEFFYLGFLLAAPPNPSGTLSVRINVFYGSGSNTITLDIKSLQMWAADTLYTGAAENATGHEFTPNGIGNVRDYILAGRRVLTRPATPVANETLVGDVIDRYPPVVGQPKGWTCTVAGNPGTWVSQGNL